MTNTDEGCRIGKSKEFRRLVLGGLGLKEIVHYANGKDPEGELVLEDGRRIGVAIGGLEFVAHDRIRITAEAHDDSTYVVRYAGPAVENADVALAFDSGTWQEEFVRDLDRWMKNGYTEDLGYVVDARITPSSA
jgi:hypothetical protein